LALQGRNQSILCFFEAYVKVALSKPVKEEEDAHKGAAFNTLRDYFGFKFDIIYKINAKVLEAKRHNLDIKDPRTLVSSRH